MQNYWYILLLVFGFSCSIPKSTIQYLSYNKIATGSGPEDILVDSITTYDRLLVSCDERRKDEERGSIWEYNFETGESRELKLVLPENYSFHPHGIDILETKNMAYLYVVNHNKNYKPEKKKSEWSEIIRFKIYQDKDPLNLQVRH